MTRKMIRSLIATAMVLTALASALPAQDAAIVWHETLEAALNAAKESDKPVMLSLHTDWCHWCHELEKQTWPDATVIEKSKGFECVQVDPEKTPLDEEYDNGSYPRILFLNGDGEIVHEIGGFAPPEPFAEEMDAALEGVEKLAEAKELAAAFAEDDQDFASAHKAGKIYLDIGRIKDALDLLKPAYEHVNELDEAIAPDVKLDYAIAVLQNRQFEEAIEILKAALEAYPEHERAPEARFALGICYANLDKLAAARAEWEAVAAGEGPEPLKARAAELVERVKEMLDGPKEPDGAEEQ